MASISKINVGGTDYTLTPASHTHGNIQNGGTLQTTDITIASGDKLVVTDSSDSSKVARTSLSFDGSTTNQYLSKKGTWVTVGSSIYWGDDASSSVSPLNADQLEGYTVNTLLKLIYPVGSVYLNINNVNPSTFITGTTWQLVSSVGLASNHVFGNGKALGITDGTHKEGLKWYNGVTADSSELGANAGNIHSGMSALTGNAALGVITKTDAGSNLGYSGLIADTITLYTWKRTA